MLVSGQWFQEQCKWNFDNRYPIRIWSDPSEVTEGDRVFLKQDDIYRFLEMNSIPLVDLVIHNTDRRFTDNTYNQLKEKVRKVYAVNATSPNVEKIPLGLRDHQYTSHDEIYELRGEAKRKERSILCLVNFMVANNPGYREPVLDHFRKLPFCTIQEYVSSHRGASLNFRNPDTIQKRREFYKTLCDTKFAICPFGAGLDTHRVYECILFGVIPIVQTSALNKLYRRLPIWIVEHWSDVTEESLQACTIRPNPKKIFDYKAPWE